jgi:hypothetical protein
MAEMDQVPVRHAPIDGRVLAHRGDHDAVHQFQPADSQRGEQHSLAHPADSLPIAALLGVQVMLPRARMGSVSRQIPDGSR